MRPLLALWLILSFSAIGASMELQFDDHVYKVHAKETQDKVAFKKHAALYKLEKSNPQYEALKKVLENAQKNNLAVQVKVDPVTMQIKEVRPK